MDPITRQIQEQMAIREQRASIYRAKVPTPEEKHEKRIQKLDAECSLALKRLERSNYHGARLLRFRGVIRTSVFGRPVIDAIGDPIATWHVFTNSHEYYRRGEIMTETLESYCLLATGIIAVYVPTGLEQVEIDGLSDTVFRSIIEHLRLLQ